MKSKYLILAILTLAILAALYLLADSSNNGDGDFTPTPIATTTNTPTPNLIPSDTPTPDTVTLDTATPSPTATATFTPTPTATNTEVPPTKKSKDGGDHKCPPGQVWNPDTGGCEGGGTQ